MVATTSFCWKTAFTSTFPTKLPLMLAPMAGVAGGALAAETCRAGALGFIAAGHLTNESQLRQLEAQIDIFRAQAPSKDAPLCIGWIGHASFSQPEGFQLYEDVLKKHKPEVVQFFAPACSYSGLTNKSNVAIAKEHGAKVLLQVGSVAEGMEAIASGADGIIAQGSEAGGHGLRRELGSGTLSLAARLVKLAAASIHKPIVLAAGGIVDGRGLAAALALGCDGAVLGTRLWASKEATNKESLKQQLVLAKSCDDVIRTTVFDHIANSYVGIPWPEPYDSVGALRNEISEEWDGRPAELREEISKEGSSLVSKFKTACAQGDASKATVLAGEGVGEINEIEPAYTIIMRIDKEAKEIVQNLSSLLA